jgi:hypothetical protein
MRPAVATHCPALSQDKAAGVREFAVGRDREALVTERADPAQVGAARAMIAVTSTSAHIGDGPAGILGADPPGTGNFRPLSQNQKTSTPPTLGSADQANARTPSSRAGRSAPALSRHSRRTARRRSPTGAASRAAVTTSCPAQKIRLRSTIPNSTVNTGAISVNSPAQAPR